MQNVRIELEGGCTFGCVAVGDVFLYNNTPYIKLNNDPCLNCKKFGTVGTGTISKSTRVIVPEEIIIK
ncbi:UNVERIFIED_ORG: hypothetical protein GCAPEGMB_00485 [Vibrio phage V07]|nr:hypothetical protein KIT05_51 [Vibrio phage KIT05]